jgi:hypothetical protein
MSFINNQKDSDISFGDDNFQITKKTWINNNGYYLIIMDDFFETNRVIKVPFKKEDEIKSSSYRFPINPESLSIKTPIATILTPTVNSVVEECSGIRFYDITISGNTGVITKKTNSKNKDERQLNNIDLKLNPNKNIAGGFGENAISAVKKMVTNVEKAANQLFGLEEDKIKNLINQISSTSDSGYNRFLELSLMIRVYYNQKKDGKTTKNLYFYSAKDNICYQVAILSFDLNRNKSSPLLYNYNIVMKGFEINETETTNTDVTVLDGLDQKLSLKSKAYNTYLEAKDLLRSVSISLPSSVINDINII